MDSSGISHDRGSLSERRVREIVRDELGRSSDGRSIKDTVGGELATATVEVIPSEGGKVDAHAAARAWARETAESIRGLSDQIAAPSAPFDPSAFSRSLRATADALDGAAVAVLDSEQEKAVLFVGLAQLAQRDATPGWQLLCSGDFLDGLREFFDGLGQVRDGTAVVGTPCMGSGASSMVDGVRVHQGSSGLASSAAATAGESSASLGDAVDRVSSRSRSTALSTGLGGES